MIDQLRLRNGVVLHVAQILHVIFVMLLPGVAEPVRAAPGAGGQSFEQFKKERDNEYEAYDRKRKRDFREYREKVKEAFNDYKAKAARVWGDDNAVMPDRHRWVEYQNDMTQRRVVDFEQGTGEISLAVDAEDVDASQTREKLKNALAETITQAPDARSVTEIADNPDEKKREGEPLLEDQVKSVGGNEVGQDSARAFAERRVKRADLEKETVKGGDGEQRVAVTVSFDLLPNHVQERAKRYEDLVIERAQSRDIKPQLVFALIETESSYNPKARSPIPAFGLMQLVPGTGARDAYRFVYDKDKLVTDTYLYDPQNNVKLGVAYMDKILEVYFDRINNDRSRQWCSVAAYNTGVGNVLRTFAGEYSESGFESRSAWRKEAFRAINRRSPKEVFRYLKVNLPYEETRSYIVKIRDRMPKYKAF